MTVDLSQFRWIYPPKHFELDVGKLTLFTDPDTDYWQRTYYGFQHDYAPAFLTTVNELEFSFTVKTKWTPVKLFDQCGIALYQDADNWFKASVEYESPQASKLGSVVTNLGYSDWATTDISSTQNEMTYRLSRRRQDFCIENAIDGVTFKQMRIFHMHQPLSTVNIGVYACSPLDCSMQAEFSDFSFGPCLWPLHTG
jgi:regulation of enolase protein 1 (concanavalin A-like superfamily)